MRIQILITILIPTVAGADETSLEDALRGEDPAALARAALEAGDPVRGALLFHRPDLACASCHGAAGGKAPLGPDLTAAGGPAGAALVESLLWPSRSIRAGFEAVTVVMRDGTVASGLVASADENAIVLRDAASLGAPRRIESSAVAMRSASTVSLMPDGVASRLASRQELLNLLAYLQEVSAKGPARALELAPDPSLLAPPVAEYEKDIDHAGMIADLDADSLKRGEVIYERVCRSCHGTQDAPGSLPSALRLATGVFKGGSDPHAMYRTLTYGLGAMAAQTWMAPRQKYDVIHYVREAYLRVSNPAQYVEVDASYLAKLPRGTSRGPAPAAVDPWVSMDYGPSLMNTLEVGTGGANIAQKGIAVRLDPGPGGISRGRHWALYEHDTLRLAAFWSGTTFINWQGIHFDGRHEVHPRLEGTVRVANPTGPGWEGPDGAGFEDPRLLGRDGKRYGPLPRDWGRYTGLYHHGARAVLAYRVGETEVLESPGVENELSSPVFTRTFRFGPRRRDLVLQAAHRAQPRSALVSARAGAVLVGRWDVTGVLFPAPAGAEWSVSADGALRLRIPAGPEPLRCTIGLADGIDAAGETALVSAWRTRPAAPDLERLTRGGPRRWPDAMRLEAKLGAADGPLAVDVLTHPAENPWLCQTRFTGLDFLPGANSAVLSTWDGDVWVASGVDRPEAGMEWRRVASGLFQPLGVKVAGGHVYVGCRDQIVVLRDLNGDGETDFYECFNSDHQVTEHFHEFAMGLETDAEGNFYYAKSARHAKTALVPHHGTLLRVSRDGARTEIVATGFRAANGVCVNPDGSFFVTDQEGHWTPKNRINRVVEGGFYGNLWGYHDVTDPSDSAMQQPLCWITNAMDRSPAELLRVRSSAWGRLDGALLSLSYGYGKIFIVPHEEVDGVFQGGVVALPIPQLPTGVMRGRFHPDNGQLYTVGMYAWAGNQQQPGGFFRVRATGHPIHVPLRLSARTGRVEIGFSAGLDPASAARAEGYLVKVWSLRRSASYGSDHINEHMLRVERASLLAGGETVRLEIPELAPAQCMEVRYSLRGVFGEIVRGSIHATVHRLGE